MSKTPDDWLEENENRLGDALDIPGPDPDFRTRLLDATARQVRLRRQRRVVMQAAAIILAFLSGMAVMSSLQVEGNPSAQVAQQSTDDPITEQTNLLPTDGTTPANSSDAQAPEFTYALLADPEAFTIRYQQADIDERLGLLRAAGDHYFFREGNIDLAADFYRRYIELADAEEKARPYDSSNWLLAAISTSTQEELQNDYEI